MQQQEDQQERRAIIAQLEEECTNQTIATELAIQAKSKPPRVELPEIYKKYASVFSEEEVQRFPPSRPWDHAIEFKDGAPDAIDCKVCQNAISKGPFSHRGHKGTAEKDIRLY